MNWKKKLGSRKFWCAVAAFLTPTLISFGVAENTVAQIVLIVSGVGALVAYIFAEAGIDRESKRLADNSIYNVYGVGGENDGKKSD